jgi:hypothetical protein
LPSPGLSSRGTCIMLCLSLFFDLRTYCVCFFPEIWKKD